MKTAAELKAYFETGDTPTQAQFGELIDVIFNGLASLPKVYRATLTQSGSGAPTATVLQNTLGLTPVWTRDSSGVYLATISSALFTANKTVGTIAKQVQDSDFVIYPTSTTVFEVDQTNLAGSPIDGLYGNYIEIIVYP